MNEGQATMNIDAVRSIANAVLYEGYILYPYRASSQKNQSRWQFGVVMAPGYAAADPSERSSTQAEVVLEHTGQPVVQVLLRFLQVQRRTTEGSGQGWDEAVEREIEVTAEARRAPVRRRGPGVRHRRRRGPRAARGSGRTAGRRTPVRGPPPGATRRPGVGAGDRGSRPVARAPAPGPGGEPDRGQPGAATAGRRAPSALIAAHTIISVTGGEFISMTDPPIWAQPAVAECQNQGGWPVLADPDGGRQVVLSSPIILYDHPELAAESPGELYDGTEIDEILTLRTLALSDAEKAEARATDPRAAALLDRVESMDAETMARLHGTIRSLRPARGGQPGTIGQPGTNGQPSPFEEPGMGRPGTGPPGAEPSAPWWIRAWMAGCPRRPTP